MIPEFRNSSASGINSFSLRSGGLNVAVLDDNVDRRNGANRVLEQRAVVIEDRSIGCKPELIVHGRKRQDFDFVLDFRDTFEAANPGFGIRLESWPGHLPAENHRVI